MQIGMRSWPGRAILFVLLPLLVGAGGGRELSVAPDPGAEHELVERINQSRERTGLPKLELNSRLAEAARACSLLQPKIKSTASKTVVPATIPMMPRLKRSRRRC